MAAVHQILEPAGRGDEDVRLLGLRGLGRDRDATVDGGDLEPTDGAQVLEHLGHLHRELAGGDEDEG